MQEPPRQLVQQADSKSLPTLKVGALEVSYDRYEGTVMVSFAGQGLALVVVPALAMTLGHDDEDARYWIDGAAGLTEPVPPSRYLVAGWPDGEGFERFFIGDLGVGPEGEQARQLAEAATALLALADRRAARADEAANGG
jgi:hypothetical protein